MTPASAYARSNRLFLGLIAGALSMLLFHQTTLQVAYWVGLSSHPAFRLSVVPPFNVPMVVSLTFWGAIFGCLISALPKFPGGLLVRGLIAGLFAVLMTWFVVRPIAGHPIAFGWAIRPMVLSALASMAWGLGLMLIQPILSPRCLLARSRAWAQHHLAT
jgi:hypothetical protein